MEVSWERDKLKISASMTKKKKFRNNLSLFLNFDSKSKRKSYYNSLKFLKTLEWRGGGKLTAELDRRVKITIVALTFPLSTTYQNEKTMKINTPVYPQRSKESSHSMLSLIPLENILLKSKSKTTSSNCFMQNLLNGGQTLYTLS